MASKSDRFYFENLVEAAEYSCRAAAYLEECLEHYQPESIGEMLKKMHELEHAGDLKKHEMSQALARAFVTPIDREDLAVVSQCVDEVTDMVEEILQRFYVDQIQVVTEEARGFARRITQCCGLMKDMLSEFGNFKKPAKLHEIAIAINQAEEECDRFYLDATFRLRAQCSDILDIISWREIYDYMENCVDSCEHVADSIETVVMKNT